MPDLGPAYNQLSLSEQGAVNKCIEALTRLHPDTGSDITVTSGFGSIMLNVKAAAGRENLVQSDMMGPITDVMLSTGVLICLLVSRRD